MMQYKEGLKKLCPFCNREVYYGLDEWGFTPFHLHCDNCNINIGAVGIQTCNEALDMIYTKCENKKIKGVRAEYDFRTKDFEYLDIWE